MATVNRVPAVVLPTELLADIFMMCLPLVVKAPWNVRVVEKPRILRPSDAPLLVASVCRRWRQVAISTPRLWLSLDLNSKRDTEGGVVAKWLERSLPYELSFALDRSTLPGMRKEVIRHCERWSVVEICVPECDPYVFDEVRGRLPCLTKLYLDCPHDVESFADAPQLRVVHIVSGFRYPDPALLPWHQLTSLTCEDFLDADILDILRQCPSLVNGCFIGFDAERSHASILSLLPLVLHHVTSLNLKGESHFDILQLLQLPSLGVLEVQLDHGTHDNDVRILSSFLTRSSCQLETLILWHITDQCLFRCLPQVPSLVTLEIKTFEDPFLTDRFLLWFTNDLSVLPRLRTLDIDFSAAYWQDWTDDLRKMILSRCLGIDVPRSILLETFRLVYNTTTDEDETGLMTLADELRPLVSPAMQEFDIRSDSILWV